MKRRLYGRMIKDRLATWLVLGGGAVVIASILGIFVFLVIETAPLMLPAKVENTGTLQERAVPDDFLAVLSDEYRSVLVRLDSAGRVHTTRLDENEPTSTTAHPALATDRSWLEARAISNAGAFLGTLDDGSLFLQPVAWSERFEGDAERFMDLSLPGPARRWIPTDERKEPPTIETFAGAWLAEDGIATLAARFSDGSLRVARRETEENDFTGEIEESWTEDRLPDAPYLDHLAVDLTGEHIVGIDGDGKLYDWSFRTEELVPGPVVESGATVLSATFLLGDRSLALGYEDGTVAIWSRVREQDGTRRFHQIRTFAPFGSAIRELAPNGRNKGFLALGEDGSLTLAHSTSERVLWRGRSELDRPQSILLTPKGDGAWISNGHAVETLSIDNPHPEASLRAFFGKIWYEDYGEPQHVWQSSSGSDDFEPKLGLVPLLFGTLKGTFFSMFLAAPLGILGAMYTSQFMHRKLQAIVKPMIELMAAIPSVILGFLAALWLAPRMEQLLPAMAALMILIPAVVLTANFLYERIPVRLRSRWHTGTEVWAFVIAIGLAIRLAVYASPWFESLFFGGNTRDWIQSVLGVSYEQRNAVVVGIAMGFAIIPIIFTVSEDAFSNVPRTLVSGSLALGATPWQTVTRIVLPTASPGIFSALMIGFGRAIGETMIVLMATGNTPIMDLNPFNGFRTLSANIAVEIPEAPVGDTLYRTLFLAALLLFLMTFVINTLAETVQHRLRKKYSEL